MYSRHKCFQLPVVEFQSTRLSRASTIQFHQLTGETDISIHKALTSLDQLIRLFCDHGKDFNPQGSHEPRRYRQHSIQKHSRFQSTRLSRASTRWTWWWQRWGKYFNPQGSHEPRPSTPRISARCSVFQSTRLSRASTAKIHNYPCIHAKFIYLNYTPSTNHPASQKIFSYFNPIFRPFAVRIPLEFYVQLLFAPEFPY